MRQIRMLGYQDFKQAGTLSYWMGQMQLARSGPDPLWVSVAETSLGFPKDDLKFWNRQGMNLWHQWRDDIHLFSAPELAVTDLNRGTWYERWVPFLLQQTITRPPAVVLQHYFVQVVAQRHLELDCEVYAGSGTDQRLKLIQGVSATDFVTGALVYPRLEERYMPPIAYDFGETLCINVEDGLLGLLL